jgi:hypothetical protein
VCLGSCQHDERAEPGSTALADFFWSRRPALFLARTALLAVRRGEATSGSSFGGRRPGREFAG